MCQVGSKGEWRREMCGGETDIEGPSPAAVFPPLSWAELHDIAYSLITGAPASWCH